MTDWVEAELGGRPVHVVAVAGIGDAASLDTPAGRLHFAEKFYTGSSRQAVAAKLIAAVDAAARGGTVFVVLRRPASELVTEGSDGVGRLVLDTLLKETTYVRDGLTVPFVSLLAAVGAVRVTLEQPPEAV